MAIPTFTDILPGVQVVTDLEDLSATVSEGQPGVFIPWSFFLSAGIQNPATLNNPEGILAAIIYYPYQWYRADSTEQPNIEYDPERPTILTRDGENKLAYQLGITLYQDFTVPGVDPDLVATS